MIRLENIRLSERQKVFEQYITGRYTKEEYKEAVNKFPLPTLQIGQLQAELEQLEETRKILHDRMSALYDEVMFESLLREQLQQVIVSGGIVSKVVFDNTKSLI